MDSSNASLKKVQERSEKLNLKPTWTEWDETRWRAGWERLIQRAIDIFDVYGENSEKEKEMAQVLLDKKYENKLWVFEEVKRLEDINAKQSHLLMNLVRDIEKLQKNT